MWTPGGVSAALCPVNFSWRTNVRCARHNYLFCSNVKMSWYPCILTCRSPNKKILSNNLLLKFSTFTSQRPYPIYLLHHKELIMSADGLNTAASSFTPAGGHSEQMDDSFAHYAQMMDDIEAEVEAEDDLAVQVPGAIDTSALPAHLAHHAAEFWFPECRNCACCNGYKHGCTCCPTNGGVCKCSGVGSLRPAPPGNAATVGSGAGGGGKPPCKFFQSPGGCRFGDGCRFAHNWWCIDLTISTRAYVLQYTLFPFSKARAWRGKVYICSESVMGLD